MSEPEPPQRLPLFERDFAPLDAPSGGVRALSIAGLALLALLLAPPAIVLALRWLPVPTSAFMLGSEVKPVQYRWVPSGAQPDALRRAVVAAEDQKFWTHGGFDFQAIAKAMEHNKRNGRVRGASTITQQVAKNLFLWPSRSWLRKGLEVTFTVLLELLWPKERILEVYLNIAEFGPGVYGVEAAARKFFHKSARQLTVTESAQLAAVLPNPRKWRAANPGRYVQARTDWILAQIGEPARFSLLPATEEPLPAEPVPAEPALEPVTETEEPASEPAEDQPASDAPVESAPPSDGAVPGAPAEPRYEIVPQPQEAPADAPSTDADGAR